MAVDSVSIGKRVRKIRKEHNLSQKVFAGKFNISQQNLSRYENGQSQIPYNDLICIAQYFNVSIEYFLDMEYRDFTKEERQLVYYYRLLNTKVQPSAIALMKTFSEEFPNENPASERWAANENPDTRR